MRLFFRIVISTSLILLLILKTGQFFYHKYFYFDSQFELLPSSTNYAVSLNSSEVLKLQDLKTKYYLTNISRFTSEQKYEVQKDNLNTIFANVTCNLNKEAFVTIFPELKPSQIKVFSNHKLIQEKNNLYLTDLDCDLNFSNTQEYKNLLVNVSKSKLGYTYISKNVLEDIIEYSPISSGVIGSLNLLKGKLMVNSYGLHSLSLNTNFTTNLKDKDLNCLTKENNFLSIKEPNIFIDESLFNSQNFIKNFKNGIQINFSDDLEICNQENKFSIDKNAKLKTIKEKLPDNSIARYYNLDLDKLFKRQEIKNQNSYFEPSLLKLSDLFIQYTFPTFKTQTYINVLSDSFNSITIVYE